VRLEGTACTGPAGGQVREDCKGPGDDRGHLQAHSRSAQAGCRRLEAELQEDGLLYMLSLFGLWCDGELCVTLVGP
jgi:hypothetical protein